MKTRTYNFHNFFTLCLNFSFLTPFDYYLTRLFAHYEAPLASQADLTISVGEPKPNPHGCFWVDGKYAIRENFIYYENRYKEARWGISIEGLESEKTTVKIHSNLMARPVLSGETLYSLIRLKLAQKNYLLVHASGIGTGGDGYFFAARGGVGKTITALHALRRGASLFGDDTVILSPAGEMFSFVVPLNLRFTYDVESLLGMRFSKALRLELALKKILSLVTFGRYRLFTVFPPQKAFPEAMGKRVPLGGGFLLVQGAEFAIEEAPAVELFLDTFVKSVQFESLELTAFLQAYAHVFPKTQLAHFWGDFRKNLGDSIKSVPCRRVTLPAYYRSEYFEELWTRINPCGQLTTTSTV